MLRSTTLATKAIRKCDWNEQAQKLSFLPWICTVQPVCWRRRLPSGYCEFTTLIAFFAIANFSLTAQLVGVSAPSSKQTRYSENKKKYATQNSNHYSITKCDKCTVMECYGERRYWPASKRSELSWLSSFRRRARDLDIFIEILLRDAARIFANNEVTDEVRICQLISRVVVGVFCVCDNWRQNASLMSLARLTPLAGEPFWTRLGCSSSSKQNCFANRALNRFEMTCNA